MIVNEKKTVKIGAACVCVYNYYVILFSDVIMRKPLQTRII